MLFSLARAYSSVAKRRIRIAEAGVRFPLGPLLRQGFAVLALLSFQRRSASTGTQRATQSRVAFCVSDEAVSCVALCGAGLVRAKQRRVRSYFLTFQLK